MISVCPLFSGEPWLMCRMQENYAAPFAWFTPPNFKWLLFGALLQYHWFCALQSTPGHGYCPEVDCDGSRMNPASIVE